MRDPGWPLNAGASMRPRSPRLISPLFGSKTVMASMFLLGVFMTCAVAADVLAAHPPDTIDLSKVERSPTFEDGHLLGTDSLGRDQLSRLLFALRASLVVAATAAFFSALIGVGVGALSGYLGGKVEAITMRITDLVLTLPALAVVLAAVEFTRIRGPVGVGIVLALLLWARLARVMRAAFLSLKQEEFVEAARALGAGRVRIAVGEMLPNTFPLIMAHITLAFVVAILGEAALSFLGFGIQPPTPTLGGLIRESRSLLAEPWWLVATPGLTLALLTLSVTFVGDGVSAAADGSRGEGGW